MGERDRSREAQAPPSSNARRRALRTFGGALLVQALTDNDPHATQDDRDLAGINVRQAAEVARILATPVKRGRTPTLLESPLIPHWREEGEPRDQDEGRNEQPFPPDLQVQALTTLTRRLTLRLFPSDPEERQQVLAEVGIPLPDNLDEVPAAVWVELASRRLPHFIDQKDIDEQRIRESDTVLQRLAREHRDLTEDAASQSRELHKTQEALAVERTRTRGLLTIQAGLAAQKAFAEAENRKLQGEAAQLRRQLRAAGIAPLPEPDDTQQASWDFFLVLPPDKKDTVRQLFRSLRESGGLTRRQVAERTGYTIKEIEVFERGDSQQLPLCWVDVLEEVDTRALHEEIDRIQSEMTVGQAIALIRRNLGIQQGDLLDRVSHNTISDLENGKSNTHKLLKQVFEKFQADERIPPDLPAMQIIRQQLEERPLADINISELSRLTHVSIPACRNVLAGAPVRKQTLVTFLEEASKFVAPADLAPYRERLAAVPDKSHYDFL